MFDEADGVDGTGAGHQQGEEAATGGSWTSIKKVKIYEIEV